MEPKLKFIQSIYSSKKDEKGERITVSNTKHLSMLNALFMEKAIYAPPVLKAGLSPRRGQLWAVKPQYEDYFGNDTNSDMPFIVLVVEANIELEEEGCCRVQPISYFTEFVAGDDYVIDDLSLIGFPFLVETWNEQPILNEVLDYFLASIDIDQYIYYKEGVKLNAVQAEFRKLEVEASIYLRHSVLSFFQFLETRQTADTGVIINMDNKVALPAFFEDGVKSAAYYAQAAKTGIGQSNKYFEWSGTLNSKPVTVRVKRKTDNFVLTVHSELKFELTDKRGDPMPATRAPDRLIFDDLLPGMYYLVDAESKSSIKIRLK